MGLFVFFGGGGVWGLSVFFFLGGGGVVWLFLCFCLFFRLVGFLGGGCVAVFCLFCFGVVVGLCVCVCGFLFVCLRGGGGLLSCWVEREGRWLKIG